MVTGFLGVRRRHIARHGRQMELRRPTSTTSYTSVPVRGIFSGYKPEQMTGGVQQGDAKVSILNDEIALLAWPGPPRRRDAMLIDARVWNVEGATLIYDGDTLIGHDLWVRGA